MEHAEALDVEAADRYVLGQLSAADADAFEEHFFDCAACAEEVRLGMRILDGGRRLASESSAETVAPVVPLARPHRSSTRGWLIAVAAALLLAIPGNVLLLMRSRDAAPAVARGAVAGLVAAEIYFDPSATRGTTEEKVLVLEDGATGQVSIDVPPGHDEYEVSVLRGDSPIATYPVSSQLAMDAIRITLADPDPGTYSLVITGRNRDAAPAEVARRTFRVARPDQTQQR